MSGKTVQLVNANTYPLEQAKTHPRIFYERPQQTNHRQTPVLAMPEGNSISEPCFLFVLHPPTETGSLQSVLRHGAQDWKANGDGMNIENDLTQSRIIVGRKPCGNPECKAEIAFTNHVAFQNCLKYRPNSLCNVCKGKKAVLSRRERQSAPVREFKLSPVTGSITV